MQIIAGSQEWLALNFYSCKRTGPLEWTIFDDDTPEPAPVCKGKSHADAVRALIAERFSEWRPPALAQDAEGVVRA